MKIQIRNFNIKQIADSGQCFRMKQIEDNKFSLIAYGKYIEIIQFETEILELSCTEDEYERIWKDYFDLSYDYYHLIRDIKEGQDNFLKKAVQYGEGIRILQQEPFEMLISFIISQNKNIPSIKICIERICERYGDPIYLEDGRCFYAFPSPQQLMKASKDELRELKLGYRDEYIMEAARVISMGELLLNDLKTIHYEEALRKLKTIKGVGDKVANCVALYGLHYIEAFPIDVWIKKVINEVYQGEFDVSKYKQNAGIVQQYMFYYMRYLTST